MPVSPWIIIVFALVLWYVHLIRPGKCDPALKRPFTGGAKFAHRGLYTEDQSVPENSIPAFNAAAENGFGMELDVQLTRDGHVVVFHDGNAKRMCGVDKRIIDMDLAEVQSLPLKGTAERIPLFADMLAAVNGRTPLIVELKDDGERNEELCRKTLKLLREYNGVFCIESFSPWIVRWFRNYAPNIYRGQLTAAYKELKPDKGPWKAFVLSRLLMNFGGRPNFVAYSTEGRCFSLRLCQLLGADKVIWTVRGTDDTAKLLRQNDAVIFEHWKDA